MRQEIESIPLPPPLQQRRPLPFCFVFIILLCGNKPPHPELPPPLFLLDTVPEADDDGGGDGGVFQWSEVPVPQPWVHRLQATLTALPLIFIQETKCTF